MTTAPNAIYNDKVVANVATHILKTIDHIHRAGKDYKHIRTGEVFDLVADQLGLSTNTVLHLTYTRIPKVLDKAALATFNQTWTKLSKVRPLGSPPVRRKGLKSHQDVQPEPVTDDPRKDEKGLFKGLPSGGAARNQLAEINEQLERDIRAAMDLCEEVGKLNLALEAENGQLKGKLQAYEVYIAQLEKDQKTVERVRLYDMTDTKPVQASGLQDDEIVEALTERGYKFKRRNGKHPIFVHPTQGMLVIPNTIIGAFRKDIMARIRGGKER